MPLDAILDRRLLIISGKGGVGKTTIAAALAMLASRRGLRVLLAEVEGKGAISNMFGASPLSQKPTELGPDLYGMNISPEESLREYFQIQLHMGRIARPLVSSHLVYYVTHAAPGLRDILMLGKVWHTATRERNFDLIVLDTPAAGHAVSMLRSPEGFLHAVPFGPLASHTRQVLEWLQDPMQVAIHLVTLAEEMPVNETIETTQMLEDRVGMDVSGIFVNMLYPPPAEDPQIAAAIERLKTAEELRIVDASVTEELASELFRCSQFYTERRGIQQTHRRALAKATSHTAPLVDMPFLFEGFFGEKEIGRLADSIEEQLD